MPGGGKGPSSSGNITQTTQNPTQQVQLPFLTGAAVDNAHQPGFNTPAGFNEALQLNETNPLQYYPGQTLANFNPNIGAGYQDLINRYGTGLGIADAGGLGFQSAVNQIGPSGSDALANARMLSGQVGAETYGLASGSNPAQTSLLNQYNSLNSLAGQATASPFIGGLNNLAYAPTSAQAYLGRLGGFGSGTLDNPASANPYAGDLNSVAQGGSGAVGAGSPTGTLQQLGQQAAGNPSAAALTQFASAPMFGVDPASQTLQSVAQAGQSLNAGTGTLNGLTTAPIYGFDQALGGLTGANAAAGQPNAATGYLGALANGAQISGETYGMNALGDAANRAGGPNTATDMLSREAGGAFLGQNPYLAGEFNAAAQPVINAYQTATAPQTDSAMEAAGRYGSGALSNARSQNEQNLGTTLGNLGANIYGQDYANERGLMTGAQGTLGGLINQGIGLQTEAGSAIGQLGLGEVGARSNAAGNLGSLLNQGIGLQQAGSADIGQLGLGAFGQRAGVASNLASEINQGLSTAGTAGSNLGQLGLGTYGARTNALNEAGNQYMGGLSTGIGAAQGAGGLMQNELGLRGNLLNQAGSQQVNTLGLGANALSGAGGLGLQDYSARAGILGNAGSLYNSGVNTAGSLAQAAGGMSTSYLNSLLSGIGAQTGALTNAGTLDTAIGRNGLIGLGTEPSVMSQNYAPAMQSIAGGQGLTGMEQQQINDQQNRFYGNIQAPWQQASQYMNLIGNPQTGSSGTTTPVLGPNGFSSALGTLGSLGSLGNNLGLFGGGGGAAGLIGQGASGAASLGALAADPAIYGADLGAAFGGGGAGMGLADFLPFLGL